MDDLISRQAAIDAICEHYTDLERRGITVLSVANHKQVTADLLECMPSAQPERCEDCRNFNKARLLIPQPEIIRCKDCKYNPNNPRPYADDVRGRNI